MKKIKSKGYLLSLVLIACSILCAIIITEVLLRGVLIARDIYSGRKIAILSDNPELGYEFRPNFKHDILQLNSHGLRGKDFPVTKKKDTYRIVVIGDSIPFGVNMTENTIYPVLLRKNLHKELQEKVRQTPPTEFEVINAGIGGYSIWQYLALYKSKIAKMSPDLIIVSICQNDFNKSGPYYTDMWGIVRGDEMNSKPNDSLWANFYLYRKLLPYFQTITRKDKNQDEMKQRVPKLSANWAKGVSPLLKLIKQVQMDGSTLLFVLFPYQYQLAGDEKQSDPMFSSFMEEKNIHFIDMLPLYRTFSGTLYDRNDQIHPNMDGHSITADAISKYVHDIFTQDQDQR